MSWHLCTTALKDWAINFTGAVFLLALRRLQAPEAILHFCLCHQLTRFFSSPSKLHNEDDSSEASSTEQPCTSAQAATSSQDHGHAPSTSVTAAVEGLPGSWSQGEGEVPPPPYASIDLGAAAAAPGVWGSITFCVCPYSCSLSHHMWLETFFFPFKL